MPNLAWFGPLLADVAGGSGPALLRVVVLTRRAESVIASVCEKRAIGRKAGGCGVEVAMLVLGAGVIAQQIERLPPPPAARVLHIE